MKKLALIVAALFLSTASLKADHPFDLPKDSRPYSLKTEEMHYAIGVTADAAQIELEDFSRWDIPECERDVIASWDIFQKNADAKPVTVHIYPNTCSFCHGNYKFIIHNVKTKEEVYANIRKSPDRNNPYTQFLRHVDVKKGRLTLVDSNGGSATYHIPHYMINTVRKWRPDSTVFIAKNRGFCSNAYNYPFVLYNYLADTSVIANNPN